MMIVFVCDLIISKTDYHKGPEHRHDSWSCEVLCPPNTEGSGVSPCTLHPPQGRLSCFYRTSGVLGYCNITL